MSDGPRAERERLLDLLADEAQSGLEVSDRSEMEFLLKRHRDVPRDALRDAVAAIDLAVASAAREPLPAALRARIRGTYRPAAAVARSSPDLPLRRAYALVYLAAAVVVLTAFFLLLRAPHDAPADLRLAEQRSEVDRLIARAHDLKRWTWKAGPDPQGSGNGVEGEVIWSSAERQGFMLFHGLQRNDKTAEQYQLWIFDKARDARYPVDGGVFDCDAGDAIVPIAAKIEVTEPTLFAVTVEKPGGVVVSDRSRIAATAGP